MKHSTAIRAIVVASFAIAFVGATLAPLVVRTVLLVLLGFLALVGATLAADGPRRRWLGILGIVIVALAAILATAEAGS